MATPIPKNRARFTLGEILTETGGTVRGPLGDAALTIDGVSSDSRSVSPGEAFIALAGERFDGHEHVGEAAARGASIAIVERASTPAVTREGMTVLRVASTLEALGKLGAFALARWRESSNGKVVALTGSAGKTTTKRAIAALLEAVHPGAVHVSAGNLNNRVGVPMTALAIADSARFAVFELGTNRPGEIAKLARIVRPDVAIVTLIASAHSEGLGGIEAIAREKTALFRDIAPLGTAIGNADDDRVSLGLSSCSASQRIGYGSAADAEYRIVRREPVSLARALVEIRRPDGSLVSFATPLLGSAGALASAAALATVEALGLQLDGPAIEAALAPLAALEEGPGRMQPRTCASGVTVLDDSYNANPASCRASIEAARELAASLGRRLVLVLGEMRELGPESPARHDELGEWAAASGARLFFAVAGEAERAARRARELGQKSEFFATAEAAAAAVDRIEPDDLVLVKGSRGVRTELVVAALAAQSAAKGARKEQGCHGVAT